MTVRIRSRVTPAKKIAAVSAPARDVSVANRHPRLRVNRRAVVRVISVLEANASRIGLRPAEIPQGEMSLVFLTDSALAKLHGDFLDEPTTTDVITFEGDSLAGTAGEICVSADTAAAYAKSNGHDFSTELTLYVVHGWLHLAGHDDLAPKKKRVMRQAEARAMHVLQHAGAIPEFKFSVSRSSR